MTRTISEVDGPDAADGSAVLDAALAELAGTVRELRCAAIAGLMRQDVSMGQLHVLWLLEHHGATSMSQLADLLGVSLSNATGLMDRMERRGLIERVRLPDDRRRVFVRPAPGGRLALEEVEGMRRDRMRAVLGRLDGHRLRRALHALRDVQQALAADSGVPGGHRHHFTDSTD